MKDEEVEVLSHKKGPGLYERTGTHRRGKEFAGDVPLQRGLVVS